jgi:CBS domain-containing protein
MSQPAFTITASDTLGAVTALMVKAELKPFPVVNNDGKLVWMLSRLDILREVAYTEPVLHAKDQQPPHAGRLVQDIMTTDNPMDNLLRSLRGVIRTGWSSLMPLGKPLDC